MSHGIQTFHESNLLVAFSPQLLNNSAVSTDYIETGNLLNIVGIVNVGATDVTVDVKFEQAKDSSGTGLKDITNAAITQLTALAGDNKQVSIQLTPDKLDTANGFTHVRLTVTAGNQTGAYVSGVVIGDVRHKPPTQPAAYAQKVTLLG